MELSNSFFAIHIRSEINIELRKFNSFIKRFELIYSVADNIYAQININNYIKNVIIYYKFQLEYMLEHNIYNKISFNHHLSIITI